MKAITYISGKKTEFTIKASRRQKSKIRNMAKKHRKAQADLIEEALDLYDKSQKAEASR